MAFEFNPNIPFYYQIKEDILQKIEQGIYAVGDQVATEFQLAEEYGVSRPTIRQAIVELVQEGVLVRGRGKGTFVAQPLISDNAQIFTTFMQPEDADSRQWTKLTDVRTVPASSKIARQLEISVGDEIHELEIVRMSGDEPVAIRTMQIPAAFIPALDRRILNNDTVYDLLQRNGLTPAAAVQFFQCAVATEQEAALLDIDFGDPLMLWQGTVYTLQNAAIIRVKTLFRGDRFSFYITQGKVELDKKTLNPLRMGLLENF